MIPILNIKHYEEKDRKFILFLILTMILTAIEVSGLVYILEEGGKIFPTKVCTRFMTMLLIPYLVMFLKCDKEKIKMTKSIYIVYIIIGAYIWIYHIFAKRSISAIDGYFLVILEFLDSIWRPSSLIIILVMTITTLIIIYRFKSGKIKNLAKTYMRVFIVSLCLILPINSVIPIYASNYRRAGIIYEKDYIEMAKFLSLDYDMVYAYNLPDYNFFCQIISDYKKITKREDVNINIDDKKVAIIVRKDFKGEIKGAIKVELNTKLMDIYVANIGEKNIQIINYL